MSATDVHSNIFSDFDDESPETPEIVETTSVKSEEVEEDTEFVLPTRKPSRIGDEENAEIIGENDEEVDEPEEEVPRANKRKPVVTDEEPEVEAPPTRKRKLIIEDEEPESDEEIVVPRRKPAVVAESSDSKRSAKVKEEDAPVVRRKADEEVVVRRNRVVDEEDAPVVRRKADEKVSRRPAEVEVAKKPQVGEKVVRKATSGLLDLLDDDDDDFPEIPESKPKSKKTVVKVIDPIDTFEKNLEDGAVEALAAACKCATSTSLREDLLEYIEKTTARQFLRSSFDEDVGLHGVKIVAGKHVVLPEGKFVTSDKEKITSAKNPFLFEKMVRVYSRVPFQADIFTFPEEFGDLDALEFIRLVYDLYEASE